MTVRLLAAIVGVLAILATAPAQAARPRVTAVAPAAAPPGAAIDIRGTGLAGRATRVSVGGKAARVVSRAATRLRVVVPRLSAGRHRVVVKRGRQVGRARLRVLPRFTGRLRVVTEPARAARGTIGPAGGVVEATGSDGTRYTLRVRPAALSEDTPITVTPVRSFRGLPLSGGSAEGVELAPDGLRFAVPATLEIAARRPFAPKTVGFSHATGDDGFEVGKAQGTGRRRTVQVEHFSTAGAAGATATDFANLVAPIVASIGTLSLPLIDSLLDIVADWEVLFGPGFCATQPVCGQAIGKALTSLDTHIDQACRTAPRTLATLRALVRFEAQRQELGATNDQSLSCRKALRTDIFNAAKQAATSDPLGRHSSTIGTAPEDGGSGDLDGDRELTHLEFLLFLGIPFQTESIDDLGTQAVQTFQTLFDALPAAGRTLCDTDRPGAERNLLRVLAYAQRLAFVVQPSIDALDYCRIALQVAPAAVALGPGATQQFAEIVTDVLDVANNSDVTWSATGGAIDQAGFYTAPTTGGTFTVKATSVINPSRSATATVQVTTVDPNDLTVEITSGSCDSGFSVECFHQEGTSITFELQISSAAPAGAQIVAKLSTSYNSGVPGSCTTYQSPPFSIGAGGSVQHTASVTCQMNPTGGTTSIQNAEARACLAGGGCGPADTESFVICRSGSSGCS